MFELRVAKYDPSHRDAHGRYKRDDWISSDDIGESFNGVVLDAVEYQRIEDIYTNRAIAYMREVGVQSLLVM